MVKVFADNFGFVSRRTFKLNKLFITAGRVFV